MGAVPYWYIVKHNPDVDAALQELREREFLAGRYNPVMRFPCKHHPIGPHSPAPGARHRSIADAFAASREEGTRSILDLTGIGDEPDFSTAARLPDEALIEHFGTTRPTREQVEQNHDFMEDIERGQGVYIVLYRDDLPDELYFAGYSFD